MLENDHKVLRYASNMVRNCFEFHFVMKTTSGTAIGKARTSLFNTQVLKISCSLMEMIIFPHILIYEITSYLNAGGEGTRD